jgi:hypothetical protein
VADRHDQPCATVAVEKIELDGIRPSAAVPPFGMCPEPSSIKPGDMPERARHPDPCLSRRRKCREPAKRTRHPDRGLLPKKSGQPGQDEASHKRVLRVGEHNLEFITTRVKIQAPVKDWILVNIWEDFV